MEVTTLKKKFAYTFIVLNTETKVFKAGWEGEGGGRGYIRILQSPRGDKVNFIVTQPNANSCDPPPPKVMNNDPS